MSEPKYHITNVFSEFVLTIEMKQKTQIMHQFWHNYVKPKHGKKQNKNMLHGYRQLYILNRNKRYSCRHCKRY